MSIPEHLEKNIPAITAGILFSIAGSVGAQGHQLVALALWVVAFFIHDWYYKKRYEE